MNKIVLIFSLCLMVLGIKAQNTKIEVSSEYGITSYMSEYVTHVGKMKYVEIPALSDQALIEFNKEVDAVFRETLEEYLGDLESKSGVHIRMSTKGEILRVTLNINSKLANLISKDKFKKFADKVKSSVQISDYLNLKNLPSARYCSYSLPVGQVKKVGN